jgi:branched-chain amino acid aminotransferase
MPPHEARVSPFDFGFLYGDGLFETLRTYGGAPFRLRAHLERLRSGVEALGIPGVPPLSVLEEWIGKTLARSALPEAYLRITVTRGRGQRGLDPSGCEAATVFIAALPLRPPAASFETGLQAVFLWPRHSGEQPPPTLKSTSYQRGVLARSRLVREGAGEGFFLDEHGHVTEGSVSNVFAVHQGALLTPPAHACLPGITRQEVLTIARELGLPVHEAPLPRERLAEAEELFVTSSLMELMPVVRLQGRPVGEGRPGPVTRNLHRLYQARTRATGERLA